MQLMTNLQEKRSNPNNFFKKNFSKFRGINARTDGGGKKSKEIVHRSMPLPLLEYFLST